MGTVLDCINNRIKTLDLLISRLQESISKRAEGEMVIAVEHGHVRYYQSIPGSRRRYLSKADHKTLESLAQKQYEQQLLEAAIKERSLLCECLEKLSELESIGINLVWNSLDESIRRYVDPDVSTDDGYAKKWKERKVHHLPRSEKHRIETLGGDFVRSKSEALIADRLFAAGIPYRYEQLLQFEHGFETIRYYPDFTILNKRTHEIFYWEHLGLLGNSDYCRDNLKKLDDYMSFGIIPGKNLILTYECDGWSLLTTRVNQLIDLWLK